MKELCHEVSARLRANRKLRREKRSSAGLHPLSHVDTDKCYEWLRLDCAALDLARQAREDGLIGTVTQISSAALLAIPALLLNSEKEFPRWAEDRLLITGVTLFVLSLSLAMTEQLMSAKSYDRQTRIARDYYLQRSEKREDETFVLWVGRIRRSAYATFAAAVLISMFALFHLESTSHGSRTKNPSSTSAAPPTTPSASVAVAVASAASEPQVRRRDSTKIEPRFDSSAPAKEVVLRCKLAGQKSYHQETGCQPYAIEK